MANIQTLDIIKHGGRKEKKKKKKNQTEKRTVCQSEA